WEKAFVPLVFCRTMSALSDFFMSGLLRLEPHFQQSRLPEFRAAQRRDMVGRIGKEPVEIVLLEQTAFTRSLRCQRVAQHVEIGASDIFQLWYGEIAFL